MSISHVESRSTARSSVRRSRDRLPQEMNAWVRPSDWIPMPGFAAGEEKVAALIAVSDSASNYIAFRCSGAYHVDWGDGTSEVVATNTTAEHQYGFSDTDLDGTLTALGFKQAMIVITPQSGQQLTSIGFNYKHSAIASSSSVKAILDLTVSAPNCTTFAVSNTSHTAPLMQRLVVYATGELTSLNSFLFGSQSLRSLDLSGLQIASSGVSLYYAFSTCGALEHLDLSHLNGNAVTSLFRLIASNSSLVSVDLPDMSTASIGSIEAIATSCAALESLDLSNVNLSGITVGGTIFFASRSLKRIVGAIPVSFSIADCQLDSSALNALYTSLPTVTGQTITVTNNPGVSGDDPSIATAKGWSVTG